MLLLRKLQPQYVDYSGAKGAALEGEYKNETPSQRECLVYMKVSKNLRAKLTTRQIVLKAPEPCTILKFLSFDFTNHSLV